MAHILRSTKKGVSLLLALVTKFHLTAFKKETCFRLLYGYIHINIVQLFTCG